VQAGQLEPIIARLDQLTVSGGRMTRCLDLAEAADLTPAGESGGDRLRNAIVWQDVRSLLQNVFRAGDARVSDLGLPDGVGSDATEGFAELLAKVIAAEELPIRPSVPEGAAERARLHHTLVERLTRVFRARLTSS
jgi:hypothetical protein